MKKLVLIALAAACAANPVMAMSEATQEAAQSRSSIMAPMLKAFRVGVGAVQVTKVANLGKRVVNKVVDLSKQAANDERVQNMYKNTTDCLTANREQIQNVYKNTAKSAAESLTANSERVKDMYNQFCPSKQAITEQAIALAHNIGTLAVAVSGNIQAVAQKTYSAGASEGYKYFTALSPQEQIYIGAAAGATILSTYALYKLLCYAKNKATSPATTK